jgi:HD-GYP domain-containing protein (c-di-GMP phosphodiesterase class II)
VLNLATCEGPEQARGPGQRTTVKFGQVGIREGAEVVPVESIPVVRLPYTLNEEVAVVRWLQERAAKQGTLGVPEVEAVVRSLAVAMHSESYLMAPILDLKQFDPYASVHSLNVAVLTMTFAESSGLTPRDVHDFGVAGLLHDIGMTRLAPNLLERTAISKEERAQVEGHTIEGARFLLASDDRYDLAAMVAYEHHIRPDGTGYPALHYPRDSHYASKMVSVCSAYDALRMSRPYRPAWQMEKVLEYIHDGAGRVFDRDVAWDFVAMMQRLEGRAMEGTEH